MPLSVILMGMGGKLSQATLKTLLATDFNIKAIFLSQSEIRGEFGIIHLTESILPKTFSGMRILDQANQANIPVYLTGNLTHPDVNRILNSLTSDFVCVAGFNKKIPNSLFRTGSVFLNLHPSLLPAHRGPDPLFWVFRYCEDKTGVTVHLIDEGIDIGDIVLQKDICLRDGISGRDVIQQIRTIGPTLLVSAMHLISIGKASFKKQDENKATYESTPSSEDVILNPNKISARCAFNFIRGINGLESYDKVQLMVNRRLYLVEKAIGFSDKKTFLPGSHIDLNREIWVHCNSGSLLVKTSDNVAV